MIERRRASGAGQCRRLGCRRGRAPTRWRHDVDHALALRAFQNLPDGRLGAHREPGLACRAGDRENRLFHGSAGHESLPPSIVRYCRKNVIPAEVIPPKCREASPDSPQWARQDFVALVIWAEDPSVRPAQSIALAVTQKPLGKEWQRRWLMCLFTSPGVHACGRNANIHPLFCVVSFRGREGLVLSQSVPASRSSPPEGG